MFRLTSRLLPPLVAFAMLAGPASADVPPAPFYDAGLLFGTLGGHFPAPFSPPIILEGCKHGHPNCSAAVAAGVIGATVVSVDGKRGADPSQVFSNAPPSGAITVVFLRSLDAGKTQQVRLRFVPR